MRIYIRGREPDLRHGLVRLLLASFDCEPGEVWIVSPWIRDVELPASDIGHFASILGGHRDHVSLSELLGRLVERHRLVIITKPPGELVPFGDIRRLVNVLDTRAGILEEEGIGDYHVVERAAATLRAEADELTRAAVRHADTLRIAWTLRERGAELLFLDRLHAKLLWTPAGALLGSANFTNGGFGTNEELMVEITTPGEHRAVGETARELEARSTPSESHDLAPALRRAGITGPDLRTWAGRLAASDHGSLRELLQLLEAFQR